MQRLMQMLLTSTCVCMHTVPIPRHRPSESGTLHTTRAWISVSIFAPSPPLATACTMYRVPDGHVQRRVGRPGPGTRITSHDIRQPALGDGKCAARPPRRGEMRREREMRCHRYIALVWRGPVPADTARAVGPRVCSRNTIYYHVHRFGDGSIYTAHSIIWRAGVAPVQ